MEGLAGPGDRTLLLTALAQGWSQHFSLTHCTKFLAQKLRAKQQLWQDCNGFALFMLNSCPLPIKTLKGLHFLSKTKVSAVHTSLPIAKNVCLFCCYP